MVPRKRRRTRLSIPLGFRQLGSTHLNRSLWCRAKRFVPAYTSQHVCPHHSCVHLQSLSRNFVITSAAGRLFVRAMYVRFLTIGTCFLAETIWMNVNNSVLS